MAGVEKRSTPASMEARRHDKMPALAIPIVASAAAITGDVHITATFRPRSPIGSTEVTTSLDPLDDTAMLNLLDATITRLIAYQQAMAENDQPVMEEDVDPAPGRAPLPLPTPWYAW